MKKLLIIFLGLSLISLPLQARKVKGIVKCEELPLDGVIVTDGEHFTTTDADGRFKFNINDDAWFVSVVTPSGYVADFSSGAPEFYIKAEGKKYFSFNLSKMSDSWDYTLFSVSDPQIRDENQLKQFCGAPLKSLVSETTKARIEGPAYGIALGDICWDNLQMLSYYKDAIRATGIPFYAVIGNHDFDKDLSGLDAARQYCDTFGPYNYAFFIGGDLFIGLKNILYKTGKKYKEGYSDEELNFIKGLLHYIPETTHIYIAGHSPILKWWLGEAIVKGDEVLELLKGRKVDFLSGHTHVQNNIEIDDNIIDHNAPSICGSWWKTNWCRDGSPRGFEIFKSRDGVLSWVLHPVDYNEDFGVKVNAPGQCKYHPNAVVANIWDYDSSWTVEWYQDGVYMGKMIKVLDVDPIYCQEILKAYKGKEIPGFRKPRTNIHYFAAEPDQYAKNVTVEVKSRFGKRWSYNVDLSECLDVQAHRGGAGLMPENTISAMKNAIKMGVNTLEMDLNISKDGKVVVSHDRYFHSRYAVRPDGTEIDANDPKEYLYTMPYDSILKYEVGMRPSAVWPEKKNIAEVKPLATDLIDFAERYTKENGLSPMRYNIEIKCSDSEGEGVNWPEYHEFVDKCIELLLSKNLGSRLVVQCFDVRALNYMHEKYPHLALSYLTDTETDYDAIMNLLDFKPVWWSPNYKAIDKELVQRCHDDGIRIVPWTCDDPLEMKRMIELGVDALITNYPDRLLYITRGY